MRFVAANALSTTELLVLGKLAEYLADRVVVLDHAPAHVVLDQPTGLPRPRQREAPALQALARTVACSL